MKLGMDTQEERLRGEGKDWGEDWGEDPEDLWGTLSLVGGASRRVKTARGDYRGFYANVRDAIEKDVADVTPEAALRAMRALLLAHKSSREGQTVRWNEEPE